MRTLLEVLLWLGLLLLPALVALSGEGDRASQGLEDIFMDSWLRASGEPGDQGLGVVWHAFFLRLPEAWGLPSGLGRVLSTGTAWLLCSLALATLLAFGFGPWTAAMGLLLLSLHPILPGLGSRLLPWLPAAALCWTGMVFLQSLGLPTLSPRPKSPGRWGPRVLAILGCGLSLGLAVSAESRMAWIMLIPGLLLFLSLLVALHALYRLRSRRPLLSNLFRPWPLLFRTLPYALLWFCVLSILLAFHERYPGPAAEALPAETTLETGLLERLLAWAALPGLCRLGYEEALRMGLRSRLGGSTILFVVLLTFWALGPALRAEAGPLERLLGAPVFAASLALWFPSPRLRRAGRLRA